MQQERAYSQKLQEGSDDEDKENKQDFGEDLE